MLQSSHEPSLPVVLALTLLIGALALAMEPSCNAFGPNPNPYDKLCGLGSVDCGNGACCVQGELCGQAETGCPADFCCASPDPFAAKRPTRQRHLPR